MQVDLDQVTVFEPTKVKSDVVSQLMQLSWKHRLGFVDRGERGPLMVPEEIDGMYWFPERIDKVVNQTKYHKEVGRRLCFIEKELPGIEITQVVIGHEIKDGPDWEEVKSQVEEYLKTNKDTAIKAAKIIVPITLVVAGGAVIVALVASAAAAAATAAAATTATVAVAAPSVGTVGALAVVAVVGVDPDYTIVVDGHWVSICSWLD